MRRAITVHTRGHWPDEAIAADSPGDLLRIAWHLGNRHLPLQALEGRLRIRADHVIAAMVEGLGGRVTWLAAPFDPEIGAYAGAAHSHGPAA